jgi:hypothetical protein
MNLLNDAPNFTFTRLEARILEEDGAFTVRVRMLNHLNHDQCVWGEEIAATIDMASLMIGCLARQFSISESGISIKITMSNFKDGTLH